MDNTMKFQLPYTPELSGTATITFDSWGQLEAHVDGWFSHELAGRGRTDSYLVLFEGQWVPMGSEGLEEEHYKRFMAASPWISAAIVAVEKLIEENPDLIEKAKLKGKETEYNRLARENTEMRDKIQMNNGRILELYTEICILENKLNGEPPPLV